MSSILIHHLTYSLPNSGPLFSQLSLALGTEKMGLVGKNGCGKTTLLRLLMGELQPDSGAIQITGTLSYCQQQQENTSSTTIADALDIRPKYDALQRIVQGSLLEADFELVGDDWGLVERAQEQLAKFGLSHLKLDQLADKLSGGEQTRLQLAKVFIADADFIILDEPTNNLDTEARQFLYDAIYDWKKGLLVVSHDRTLLNLVDHIIEINSLGVHSYGGNFDHYQEQKKLMSDAAQHELLDAKKSLHKSKTSIQSSREKRERKQSVGRKLFLTGKIDRIGANAKRGKSERTQKRLVTQADILLKQANEQLDQAKAKIEITSKIEVDLPETYIPNGKMILRMKDVSFAYDRPLIHAFNLQIMGPERIALIGNNGSGKTTLIKLILNQLQPMQGSIELGTDRVSYLDQHIHMLDPQLSILDNFLKTNREVKLVDAHHALAQFLFRNTAALKQVHTLSGGEKLRAGLACTLLSKHPPQLLILDEPTNHLDLESILSIESALQHYQGALLVISHDQRFLENIGVERVVGPSS